MDNARFAFQDLDLETRIFCQVVIIIFTLTAQKDGLQRSDNKNNACPNFKKELDRDSFRDETNFAKNVHSFNKQNLHFRNDRSQ